MSTSAGRVMPIPKGAYDSATTYHVLDIVTYNGSSYICKATTTGNVPTNTTYWQLNASGSAVSSLDEIGDVDITSVTNGQVLKYNSSASKWENGDAESGGLLPHIIVISESGSTVSAVKDGTTINFTETSSGHFEGDVTEFGTWTIHAVLSGDDATVSLVVDTVKVYTVDDSHFHADITVNFPSGATCSCGKVGKTPVYASSNPYTFTANEAGTYTITATDGTSTASQTVVISTSGQTETVTLTFTQTLTVDVYSAANDSVSYTDIYGDSQVITTDSSGHATASIVILLSGSSITFTSSVAKNTTPNSTDDYTKTISLTTATTSIYIMPDVVAYWYGYAPYTLNKSASGYASQAKVQPSLTMNANSFTAGNAINTEGCIGIYNLDENIRSATTCRWRGTSNPASGAGNSYIYGLGYSANSSTTPPSGGDAGRWSAQSGAFDHANIAAPTSAQTAMWLWFYYGAYVTTSAIWFE